MALPDRGARTEEAGLRSGRERMRVDDDATMAKEVPMPASSLLSSPVPFLASSLRCCCELQRREGLIELRAAEGSFFLEAKERCKKEKEREKVL